MSKFLETWRDDLTAAGFEFLGTVTFLILGLGPIQSASLAAGSTGLDQLMYISAGLGLGLLVAVWLFFRVTGGLFNPNITTALLITGVIGPLRWLFYCIAQMLGAIIACAILDGLMPGPLSVSTVPGPGINRAQAVFIEIFMACFLTFAVLMLAVEKHRSTPFAPVGIGLTLFACELWGLELTGGSMNTARSFGPAVIAGFHNTQWIYWLGPVLGALLAAGIYIVAKRSAYWTLAPDQDTQKSEKSPDDPLKQLEAGRR